MRAFATLFFVLSAGPALAKPAAVRVDTVTDLIHAIGADAAPVIVLSKAYITRWRSDGFFVGAAGDRELPVDIEALSPAGRSRVEPCRRKSCAFDFVFGIGLPGAEGVPKITSIGVQPSGSSKARAWLTNGWAPPSKTVSPAEAAAHRDEWKPPRETIKAR